MTHWNGGKTTRKKRAPRRETRLVLPSISDDCQNDEVLKSLVETWLVPRLVEDFIQEHVSDVARKEVQPSSHLHHEKLRTVA